MVESSFLGPEAAEHYSSGYEATRLCGSAQGELERIPLAGDHRSLPTGSPRKDSRHWRGGGRVFAVVNGPRL